LIDQQQIRDKLQRDERALKAKAGYAVQGLAPCPRRMCEGSIEREPDGWGTCSECGLKDWYPPPKVMAYLRGREV
jgi:hypothetical protein